MKNRRVWLAGIFILAASSLFGFLSCGSTTSSSATPESLLVGEWLGKNSTNNCVAASNPCYNAQFVVTFTKNGTYSIVTNEGGADAGTFVATASTITTTTVTIKTSACFTTDFFSGTAYTLSSDGKTLTIPVCPLIFAKQ